MVAWPHTDVNNYLHKRRVLQYGGMATWHVVGEGDFVASVACAHGLLPETVWNHPENAALREQRESMYVLCAGDRVFIPDRVVVARRARTGARHVFRRGTHHARGAGVSPSG
jgi:hypothetical protein